MPYYLYTGLITTSKGTIKADFVVNCGGMWARELGKQTGGELLREAGPGFFDGD